MVTFDAILNLDVNSLESFAGRWRRIHKKVGDAREEFYEGVAKKLKDDGWRGKGGQAAESHCDQLHKALEAFEKQVRELGRAVDREADGEIGGGGAAGLEGIKSRALAIHREARENGISISGKGELSWSYFYDPEEPQAEEDRKKHTNLVKDLEGRIAKLLADAEKIDDRLSYSLKSRIGTPRNFETENREHGVLDSDGRDRLTHNKMQNVAAAFAMKYKYRTASGLLEHYLGGSGEAVEVEPEKMMQDIPAFKEDVDKTLKDEVKNAPDGKFTTEWQKSSPDVSDGHGSLDWYYALNNFQYRLVGEKVNGEVVYQVEVQKRYDWGTPSEGKRTLDSGLPGPFNTELEQADAARLHSVGMAKDFDVNGRSGDMKASA